MNLDAAKFLEDLGTRQSRLYFAALHDLYVAIVRSNPIQSLDAREALDKTMRETMGAAEVLGALSVLQPTAREIAKRSRQMRAAVANELVAFAATPTQTILPNVTLKEAVADMVQRTPRIIRRAAERTADAIAKLYSEANVVAFTHSAEASVTREAQKFITRALREGIPAGEGGRALAMKVNEIRVRSKEWTEGYARMAFRTNVNTAVTAGRFRQAQDSDIKTIMPAFRFAAIGDVDTRENHNAGDDRILRVDNPNWGRLAPPLGYQ